MIADRTACSILTLFIAIATSRPLNKKNPFAVSPRIQLRICVRNPQSAYGTLSLPSRQASACEAEEACRDGAVPCVIVDKRGVPLRRPCTRIAWIHSLHLWRFSLFSARQHICYSALYAIARPSVRPSLCPSHGWISQRRLKLGSRNLHHRVAPWI